MRYFFNYKKEKINIDVKKLKRLEMVRGLMFTKKQKAQALLFEPACSIHSFFVRFDFLAVWLDKNNKVLQIEKVKPYRFCISMKKKAAKLLEIPINNKYKDILKKLRR